MNRLTFAVRLFRDSIGLARERRAFWLPFVMVLLGAATALVVASAGKPACSSSLALPTSHGLGMTKTSSPSWSSAKRTLGAERSSLATRRRRVTRSTWRVSNGDTPISSS